MPRFPRPLYPNAYYHVMNRGAGKQDIFFNDQHRHLFLSLLEEVTYLFKAEIIAFCLMPNHYHLLIKTPEANLDKIMQRIDGFYTKRLNYLLKRDGPIFRGRYKAILIDSDEQLLTTSCYIHLNPVKSHLILKAEDYRWSSYSSYIKEWSYYPWLKTNLVLDLINSNTPKKSYKNHVKNNIFKNKSWGNIKQNSDKKPSIQKICRAIMQHYKIKDEAIIYGIHRKKNIPKIMFVYLCQIDFNYSHAEIAKFLGTTNRRALISLMARNKKLVQKNNEIQQQRIIILKNLSLPPGV